MMLLAEPRVVRGESDCDQDQSSDSMETTDPPEEIDPSTMLPDGPDEPITSSVNDEFSDTEKEAADIIARFEGYSTKVYYLTEDRTDPTIGRGFNFARHSAKKDFKEVLPERDFDSVKDGKEDLTKNEIDKLFAHDIKANTDWVQNQVIGQKLFNSFPVDVQAAIVNGFYRGDIRKDDKTVELIKNKKWDCVSTEYLDHDEYRKATKKNITGIVNRMDYNAAVFKKYAMELKKEQKKERKEKEGNE